MGSGMRRDEYSLVGWGRGQAGDGGGSSLESSGATPPGFPSWRPGLGRDGGVWGPRPGLTLLGLSPSSPWRSEMETSLAPRPRSPGQEWPLGVCAPSVRYGPSDSGSLTMCPQPSVSRPKNPVPVLLLQRAPYATLSDLGTCPRACLNTDHLPPQSQVVTAHLAISLSPLPTSLLSSPSSLSPLSPATHSAPPSYTSWPRVLGHSLTGALT